MSPDTIVLIAAISLFILGYIYLLIKIPQLESVGGRLGKWRIRVFGFLFGSLVITYLFYKLSEIQPNEWVEISLLAGLVGATSALAVYAAGQAYTSVKMAEEMKEQRVTASRPVVVQKAVHEKDIYEGSTKDYFSHFEAYNKGNGPAIEVEISLLDNDKNLIESHRKSFLGAGEPPIEFRPTSLAARRENSTCYLVCEYQSILSSGPRKMWYQTWLPFKPSKSSEKDKIYVVAGELEFKEVNEKERIDAFSSRSKPK